MGRPVRAASAERAAAALAAAEAAAQAALQAEEPALRECGGTYRRAVEVAAELGGLRRERAAVLGRREAVSSGLAAAQERMNRERELLARGQKKQQELQQSLLPLAVRSQERQSLQEAMQRLQGLRSAETQRDSAERERQGRAAVLAAAEARLAAAGGRRQELAVQRGGLVAAAALHLEVLRAAEAAAGEAAVRLEQHGGALEAARKEQEVHRLSLALAGELQSGLPCPVCGSEHHPSPASVQDGGGDDELAGRLEHARLLARQALDTRHLFRSLLEQDGAWLAQVYGESMPELPAAAGLEQVSAAGMHSVPGADETLHAGLLTELEDRLAGCKARSGSLRSDAAQWQRAMQEQQQLYHKEEAAVEAEAAWLAGLVSKARELAGQADSLHREWAALFPGLAADEAEAAYRAVLLKDEQAEEIRGRLEISVKFLDDKSAAVQALQEEISGLDKELAHLHAQLEGKEALEREKAERLQQWTGGRAAAELLAESERQLQQLQAALERSRLSHRQAAEKAQHELKEAAIARQAAESAGEHYAEASARWQESLESSPFASAAEVEAAALPPEERNAAMLSVRSHREEEAEVNLQLRSIAGKLQGAALSTEEWQESQAVLRQCREDDEEALRSRARAERDLEDLQQRHIRWMELEGQRIGHAALQDRLSKLQTVLRGNAFVEYIAEEQLMQVCQAASQRLRFLSKQRYALEVDSGGGFVIRDDGNGGVRRPVSTLSGGETFLTSLSLALALSAQIQLRGQYPLQFFFLDEGFGTLDPDLLDTVITSLEKLHNDQLSVGIISHVPELRARLPRKLIVVPAEQGGGGSHILLEKM
ncbi:SbcC/MukB-like Walker B domain-containing protein [Paenibacillus camerounensis]|uniref:SbcC/MukB-like Walker B domain-containing protein n=1 Tax=Paenibacillus camerounensis TaxID=1243663 RepID=UPI0006948F59|nr:SbcC/MukB-like Walker B domain-containing protein [Paenibacillus camerounensis]